MEDPGKCWPCLSQCIATESTVCLVSALILKLTGCYSYDVLYPVLGMHCICIVQLMHTMIMRKKDSEALWHWSRVLESKVMTAWLLYAIQKKRKRERYGQAMERHRKRLVKIGVKQWIRVRVRGNQSSCLYHIDHCVVWDKL